MTDTDEPQAKSSDVHMDREDYQNEPAQHRDFSDHCAIAIAAIICVACGIGSAWGIYLFPVATMCAAGLIGSALFATHFILARGSS